MEENKYYTPKLEEFHVGFEYGFKSRSNYGYHSIHDCKKWTRQKFAAANSYDEKNEIECIEEAIRENDLYKVRVKYLDREDIESLGWVKRDEPYAPSSTYLPKTSILESYYKNKTELYITKHSDFYPPKHLMIYQLSALRGYGDEEYRSVFKGIVKNKSELKKLMEMLQINS